MGKVGDFHEESHMVFEREIPLIQHEEKDGWVIHNEKTVKHKDDAHNTFWSDIQQVLVQKKAR